ncbi:MAG TPA: hypothetical protein VFO30_06225 [Chthoniobacterales bacterium]|nr:hypothetical protein [Chthoniobacterales bacterium]
MTLVLPSLRAGFYAGLGFALVLGMYLLWLWQPQRQVRRHTQHLFEAVEKRNWSRVAEFIAPEFTDQWGDDHARLLERTREVLRYVRSIRITASDAWVLTQRCRAVWTGKVTVEGEQGEITAEIKSRVNSLATPFELEWRRVSTKPWDWKLVRVSNRSLEIPAEFE